MAEAHDRREPQGRRGGVIGAAARLRRGEQCDLGIRACQYDDIGRILAEIDRSRAVGDHSGFGGEQVHSVFQRHRGGG